MRVGVNVRVRVRVRVGARVRVRTVARLLPLESVVDWPPASRNCAITSTQAKTWGT